MNNKELSTVVGKVLSVSAWINIPRINKVPINKRTIGIITNDQQVVYLELRNNQDKEFQSGEKVTAEYYFAGSAKEGKYYNNLIATKISINE